VILVILFWTIEIAVTIVTAFVLRALFLCVRDGYLRIGYAFMWRVPFS
jgi:hypothetical protein